jgi:hypothetical protein
MQPTNLSGVRGGAPPALPPKPKPRNPGLVFSGSKVAPMSNPVPPPTVSISKPPVSFPPKSEQVLGKQLTFSSFVKRILKYLNLF